MSMTIVKQIILPSFPTSQKSNAREQKPFYGIYLKLGETIVEGEVVDYFKRFVKLHFSSQRK